ncbi:hypothetical protein BYT27DRAFT_7247508 [Phlegmacium glaucopus]|nr:hypothetical protein BYT27DRAFT_7247508 [Phlegmacium glaucopus]
MSFLLTIRRFSPPLPATLAIGLGRQTSTNSYRLAGDDDKRKGLKFGTHDSDPSFSSFSMSFNVESNYGLSHRNSAFPTVPVGLWRIPTILCCDRFANQGNSALWGVQRDNPHCAGPGSTLLLRLAHSTGIRPEKLRVLMLVRTNRFYEFPNVNAPDNTLFPKVSIGCRNGPPEGDNVEKNAGVDVSDSDSDFSWVEVIHSWITEVQSEAEDTGGEISLHIGKLVLVYDESLQSLDTNNFLDLFLSGLEKKSAHIVVDCPPPC